MLGSVGSVVPKRWILGIFALGLIAVMVATSASPWAGAATLPTSVTATAVTSTSIQVDWTAAESGSTVPESYGGSLTGLVDAYTVDCVGTPGTVSVTVAGISTTTATVVGLTANTAYVCSVFTSSTGTVPASGVAASSVTTPASAAATLDEAFINLATANVQVGGTLNLGVLAIGADSGLTVITTGVTVVWSSTANGSVSPTTGTSTTYTASSAGSATVTATLTQTATGIVKTDTLAVTNFAVPADPAPEPSVDPPASEIPDLPDISDAEAGTAAATVLKPSSGAISLAVTGAAATSETASVGFPAGSISNSIAAAVRVDITPVTSAVTALPADTVSISDSVLTVELTDKSGAPLTIDRLVSAATVTMTVPLAKVQSSGADIQGVSLYKAASITAPEWVKVNTRFSIVGGDVVFAGDVMNFSVFRLGFEIRDGGTAPAAAVLPSAGDVAPTTTQALLITGFGLLLIVGAGVYVRRQRRATEVD